VVFKALGLCEGYRPHTWGRRIAGWLKIKKITKKVEKEHEIEL
jgi:hypothetical protein